MAPGVTILSWSNKNAQQEMDPTLSMPRPGTLDKQESLGCSRQPVGCKQTNPPSLEGTLMHACKKGAPGETEAGEGSQAAQLLHMLVGQLRALQAQAAQICERCQKVYASCRAQGQPCAPEKFLYEC